MNNNVFFFLKNKNEVKYLTGNMTIQQGLDAMKSHSFTSTPVIDNNGYYLGALTEGDFLWYLVSNPSKEEIETKHIKKLIRKDYMPAASITTSIEDLLRMSSKQNYIPIVDDRNIFIGIVTRKKIIETLLKETSIA